MSTKELAKLNVSVVSQALALIQNKQVSHTCTALSIGANGEAEDDTLYLSTYREYILNLNRDTWPDWWDKNNTAVNKKHRICALKGFKDAIGLAQKVEDLADWKEVIDKVQKHHLKAQEHLDKAQELLNNLVNSYDRKKKHHEIHFRNHQAHHSSCWQPQYR